MSYEASLNGSYPCDYGIGITLIDSILTSVKVHERFDEPLFSQAHQLLCCLKNLFMVER